MTQSKEQNGASIAYEWWRRLNPVEGRPSGAQRAALARIRRAATPLEVIQEPEALRLVARLPRNPKRAATLAGILAFVRETDERSVARAVGRTTLEDDRSALLAEARFRRLLQLSSSELMEPMRRLVRHAKGRVSVHDLSVAVLYWGDRVKERWIYDYYGVRLAMRSGADGRTPRGSSKPDRQEQNRGIR